jgi:large subunit ribosomal protein L13
VPALQPVGRLAAQLAKVLQGKDKPIYDPSRDLGDICIVINAEKAVLTGRKWDRKTYTWHTGKWMAAEAKWRLV